MRLRNGENAMKELFWDLFELYCMLIVEGLGLPPFCKFDLYKCCTKSTFE